MKCSEFRELLQRAGRRCVLAGDEDYGVFAAPDLEARLFLVYKGEVISRVNSDAILHYSDRTIYRNPGGDGLWPAPEGSRYGYNYATGGWCVPTGLLRARFDVAQEHGKTILTGEVPLINSQGIGLLTLFTRSIEVSQEKGAVIEDTIEYLGAIKQNADEVRLAAWSLSQFDRHAGDFCELEKPCVIRDLYTESSRFRAGNRCMPTDEVRYQVACGEDCTGIRLCLQDRNVAVARKVLNVGGEYISIADMDPSLELSPDPVKYSFYSDPSGFMEIETAGPGLKKLVQGDKVSLTTENRIISVQ